MKSSRTVAGGLPDDVLADILCHLPERSLTASRLVCKAWKTVIDGHHLLLQVRRRLLSQSVRGLFVNYIDHYRPHFFGRPTSAAAGPRIDGEFSFIPLHEDWRWYNILDSCNGHVLRSSDDFSREKNMYVLNPATQQWACLPQCGKDDSVRRAFIVFDPAVSMHYEVLMAPTEPEREEQSMEEEWPPSTWTWHVFSSTTKKWEERVFIRDGEAAGNIATLPKPEYGDDVTRWRYGAYWKGTLYMHYRGEFVLRLSLSNNIYNVIKSPIDYEKGNWHEYSFIGKSKNGLYFAYLRVKTLRVWILSESEDKRTQWVLKHQSVLKTQAWRMSDGTTYEDYVQKRYDGPWIIDICDDGSDDGDSDDESNHERGRKVGWDSDEDNIIQISNNDEDKFGGKVDKFLGFHPYKEIIFLHDGVTAVAYHLNSTKVQYLGRILPPDTYHCGFYESFVYTPCLIGD